VIVEVDKEGTRWIEDEWKDLDEDEEELDDEEKDMCGNDGEEG